MSLLEKKSQILYNSDVEQVKSYRRHDQIFTKGTSWIEKRAFGLSIISKKL